MSVPGITIGAETTVSTTIGLITNKTDKDVLAAITTEGKVIRLWIRYGTADLQCLWAPNCVYHIYHVLDPNYLPDAIPILKRIDPISSRPPPPTTLKKL